MSEKEKINQLKYMLETFSFENKDFEDGFVGGLFYAVTLLEHGKEYADSKIDWKSIKRRDNKYNADIQEETCSCCK